MKLVCVCVCVCVPHRASVCQAERILVRKQEMLYDGGAVFWGRTEDSGQRGMITGKVDARNKTHTHTHREKYTVKENVRHGGVRKSRTVRRKKNSAGRTTRRAHCSPPPTPPFPKASRTLHIPTDPQQAARRLQLQTSGSSSPYDSPFFSLSKNRIRRCA